MVGFDHPVNQPLKGIHLFLEECIIMVTMCVHSLPLFQLLEQLKIFLCNFSLAGIGSDILQEGLYPLKDVEYLSVLGFGVCIYEVEVIRGC
jgi:hypothetical protein